MSSFVEVAVASARNSTNVEQLNETVNKWVTKVVETYPGLVIADIDLKPVTEYRVLITIQYRHTDAITRMDGLAPMFTE